MHASPLDSESPTSDEQLIAAFRDRGDAACLNELMSRHLARVRAMMQQMTLDPATADDLTQDVFLRVFRHIDKYDGRSKFSTWLYRVAINTACNALRNRGPRIDPSNTLEHHVAAQDLRPDGPALQQELSADVTRAIDQLTPKLRAAIVLTSLHSLPISEAAAIEQCTTATMYGRLHAARQQLKRLLKEHLES